MPLISLPARRLTAALIAAVAGLTAVQAAPAHAAPGQAAPARIVPVRSVLTTEARAAGVEPGNAPMGWKQAADRRAALGQARGVVSAAPNLATAKKGFVPAGVLGIDVSSWQGDVNWATYAGAGKRFVYVKATEGTGYKNPYFGKQYSGASTAGLVRGAYHFATPSSSYARTQAAYFVKNGGGWSADGKTLPGVLDIEYNPYGATCYGFSQAKMTKWVKNFLTEYKRLTSRDAVIYTTTDWWTRCTGNTRAFSSTNPLWLARYGTTDPGTLPGGWTWATFWQYSATPIDQNRFSSSYKRLVVLAKNAR